MKQIKIQKKTWKNFSSGKKKYYIAPLRKGLTTDTYEFVSVDYEVKRVKKTFCDGEVFRYVPKIKGKTFGTAKLTLSELSNNIIFETGWLYEDEEAKAKGSDFYFFYHKRYEDDCYYDKDDPYEFSDWLQEVNANYIDKETYDFVKENYIDKGIEFVVYEISEVKKWLK